MNFIIDLLSNKREDVVYNTIFVVIDKCTKLIKYLSMIIKIEIAKLIKLFFGKDVLRFNISEDIINNKIFLFINIF